MIRTDDTHHNQREEVRPNVVLILSTGRTGTRSLAHFLHTCFTDVSAYHTTPYSRLFNVLGNLYRGGLFPERGLILLWERLKRQEVETCSTPFFVDSNPHLFGMLPLANKLYQHLKIVHVVRDPRTYVRSHLNWARHRPASFVANYFIPFWQPNAFLLGEMGLEEWLGLSRFERYCWVWAFKNRDIESLAGSDVPYYQVRFEALFGAAEAEETVNSLLAFMGLPRVAGVGAQLAQPMNETRKRSFPAWQHWPPEWCYRLDKWCSPLMNHYDYGREADWQEKVALGQKV